MDYYMKAANEAALRAALVEAGVVVINEATVDEAGEVLVPAHDGVADGFALDVIGPIFKPTGKMIAVGDMEVPEMAALDGYHANLRGELSDSQATILAPLILPAPPANPYRTWADMPPAVEAEEIPVDVIADEVQP